MLEFDGGYWARVRASSINTRGTGWGKNIRVEWRALIICSRSNIVLRFQTLLLGPSF
jgi:hypothetical protein